MPRNNFFWKRYIDDIFFISSSSSILILDKANDCNQFIKFTLELPQNGGLSFLDTFVRNINRKFVFDLYVKPTLSGTCLPFDSFISLFRKRALNTAEFHRVKRNTFDDYFHKTLGMIKSKFLSNGYPEDFINNTLSFKSFDNMDNRPNFISYIKIPYISQQQNNLIKRLLHNTGLDKKIRFIFTPEKNLGLSLRVKKEHLRCQSEFISCQTAEIKGACFVNFAVYLVKCNLCGAVYVGQTQQILRSRIKEHISDTTSIIYLHMSTHGNDNISNFKWKILTTERLESTRLVKEASYIKSYNNLMNGCEGSKLLTFLI